jgi:hypothetical protein
MIRTTLVVVVILLLIGSISAASASFGDDRNSKFGFRVQSFIPFDDSLKDVQSVWFGGALDYTVKADSDGRPLSYLSLSFVSTGDDYPKLSEDSLTYTMLRRKPISDSRSHYIGYGGGIYRIKAPAGSTTQPSIHVLYGQEFKGNYFAELRLDLHPEWRETQWSGIYLNVGTRISF